MITKIKPNTFTEIKLPKECEGMTEEEFIEWTKERQKELMNKCWESLANWNATGEFKGDD